MDEMENLITKITREVVSRLNAQETKEVKKEIKDEIKKEEIKSKKILAVLTGGAEKVDEALKQLDILSQSNDVSIVLSKAAESIIGISKVRAKVPNAKFIENTNYESIGKILDDTNIVVVPTLTLNTAAKVASLNADNFTTILLTHAILRGLKVVMATNSLYCCVIKPETMPLGAKKKIDSIISQLKEYGVDMVDVSEINNALKKCLEGVCGTKEECIGCGKCITNNPQAVANIIDSGASRIGASSGATPIDPKIASMIDHTLLKPDATEKEIRKLCEEAAQYKFASVCVNPAYVPLAAKLLKGTGVKVCTVIGFPLGATTSTTKAIETRDAIANGADEIDMVINVGALKSGDDETVRKDIQAVVDAAKGRAIVKVILETALLTKEEKIKGCLLAKMAGADFVKTSTGFGPGGATVEDVALMRKTVGPEMGVKASGGIRTYEAAKAMIEAGATRIGASASVAIAKGTSAQTKGY